MWTSINQGGGHSLWSTILFNFNTWPMSCNLVQQQRFNNMQWYKKKIILKSKLFLSFYLLFVFSLLLCFCLFHSLAMPWSSKVGQGDHQSINKATDQSTMKQGRFKFEVADVMTYGLLP
jgi:hypothetical protein